MEQRAILVVEDTPAIAEIIETVLNDVPDYQATTVANGADALAFVAVVRVNLVLLDINLPGLDGFAIHDLWRALPHTATVPILFMTAGRHDAEFARRGVQPISRSRSIWTTCWRARPQPSRGGGRWGRRPRDQGGDQRQQLGEGERLGEEGGEAVGGVVGVLGGVAGGAEDQRGGPRRAGERVQVRPGLVGMEGVGEHQTDAEGREDVQPGRDGRGDEHAVALLGQHIPEQGGDVWGVVHHEDRPARLHGLPPLGANLWRNLGKYSAIGRPVPVRRAMWPFVTMSVARRGGDGNRTSVWTLCAGSLTRGIRKGRCQPNTAPPGWMHGARSPQAPRTLNTTHGGG